MYGAGRPIPGRVWLVDPHRLLHRETCLLIPVEANDIDVCVFLFFKQLWNAFVAICDWLWMVLNVSLAVKFMPF